ncbi:MAG: ATP-dependent RecD-like DNA helicase [Lachnospiraceae bacterium]|nr:ATP-dependent RecD-like DNA helicase [Lachnospiraceae bacterium]
MEEFRGYVEHIIFRSEETGYTVFELNSEENRITCTGHPAAISEGESCRVTGTFVTHAVYGEQLKIESYEAVMPETAEAVLRYLSSGAIKGIGAALAARIVKRFGNDTMRIMDEEPERLAEIKGISMRGAREIAAQIEEKRDLRDAMMFLQQYGITNNLAVKIWKTYGMDVYKVLKENPYRLAEDIRGIGFATADLIASRAGIRADSDFRIRSGLKYLLSEASGEGHSYLPREEVLARAVRLLQAEPEQIEMQLDNLLVERELVAKGRDPQQVYSPRAFREEQQIARMLLELDSDRPHDADLAQIDERIRRIEEREGIELDELQRSAVRMAVEHTVLLISGGPGTGKTTTINTIIRLLHDLGLSVMLAAPTGRAARRMTEATGYPAMTIHRLLGVRGVPGDDTLSGTVGFEKDRDNPLETDALIIDEMSMVDTHLFCSLLKAVLPGTRLILVGDVDQLPSVGPGRVLRDLMDSGAFRTVLLKTIFRQAMESDIVMNAHRILNGEMLELDNRSKDFFFLERSDVGVIYKHTVDLLQGRMPAYAGCSPWEVQVLTPMRKGNLGVLRLNEVLQSILNPPAPGKAEHTRADVTFREGDKVMQTRNNYQIAWEVRGNFGIPIEQGTGIFNGDFGRVEEIDTAAQTMTVRFDEDRIVTYPFGELDDLDLAYAVTVHKSQGSEYPAVILPLLQGPSGLFNRNLLYTAVTRAKNCVVILGSREALRSMIANTRESRRYTGLKERIDECRRMAEGPALSQEMPGL